MLLEMMGTIGAAFKKKWRKEKTADFFSELVGTLLTLGMSLYFAATTYAIGHDQLRMAYESTGIDSVLREFSGAILLIVSLGCQVYMIMVAFFIEMGDSFQEKKEVVGGQPQ